MMMSGSSSASPEAALDAADLGAARQEDEQTAVVLAERAADGGSDRRLDRGRRPVGRDRRVATGKLRPALVTTGASPSSAATASPSSVADMTSRRRSSRRRAACFERQREAEIGVEAALVELVEDDEADAVERRIVLEQRG